MTEWLLEYWLEVIFAGVVGVVGCALRLLWGRLQAYNTQQENLRYGVLALLRNSLIRNYNDYMHRGYVPIYAMDSIETMYQAYRDLGGNGAVTKLYQELKELPTKDPREENRK